jgi:hypothetical protein
MNMCMYVMYNSKVSKDIPVTGHGGPQGCERLRLPHYLDKQLTDGGKVVSPTCPPHLKKPGGKVQRARRADNLISVRG